MNHIGKGSIFLFFKIKSVSFFRVIRGLTGSSLTVCSAIARCMRWERNAEEILYFWKMGLRIAAAVYFPINRITMGMSQNILDKINTLGL